MKITYTIYALEKDLLERKNGIKVETCDNLAIQAFEIANKLYVGAVYAGCVIEKIEKSCEKLK